MWPPFRVLVFMYVYFLYMPAFSSQALPKPLSHDIRWPTRLDFILEVCSHVPMYIIQCICCICLMPPSIWANCSNTRFFRYSPLELNYPDTAPSSSLSPMCHRHNYRQIDKAEFLGWRKVQIIAWWFRNWFYVSKRFQCKALRIYCATICASAISGWWIGN